MALWKYWMTKEDDFFSALHFWGAEFFASMTDRVISFAQLTFWVNAEHRGNTGDGSMC